MEKPKLIPSLKSLHQALFSSRPKPKPLGCTQHPKTDPCQDPHCSSSPSVYCSASSSNSFDTNEDTQQPCSQDKYCTLSYQATTASSSSSSYDNDDGDNFADYVVNGSISSKRFFFTPCTTKSLSSNAATESDEYNSAELSPPQRNFISSRRFFFYPCTTKSIMDEKIELSGGEWSATEAEAEEKQGWRRQCMAMERGLCQEMAMASTNPFMDFRASMEEMVVAHGLREWPCLPELLQCYLRLNDKSVHKFVVLAFADLLMSLFDGDDSN